MSLAEWGGCPACWVVGRADKPSNSALQLTINCKQQAASGLRPAAPSCISSPHLACSPLKPAAHPPALQHPPLLRSLHQQCSPPQQPAVMAPKRGEQPDEEFNVPPGAHGCPNARGRPPALCLSAPPFRQLRCHRSTHGAAPLLCSAARELWDGQRMLPRLPRTTAASGRPPPLPPPAAAHVRRPPCSLTLPLVRCSNSCCRGAAAADGGRRQRGPGAGAAGPRLR